MGKPAYYIHRSSDGKYSDHDNRTAGNIVLKVSFCPVSLQTGSDGYICCIARQWPMFRAFKKEDETQEDSNESGEKGNETTESHQVPLFGVRSIPFSTPLLQGCIIRYSQVLWKVTQKYLSTEEINFCGTGNRSEKDVNQLDHPGHGSISKIGD